MIKIVFQYLKSKIPRLFPEKALKSNKLKKKLKTNMTMSIKLLITA